MSVVRPFLVAALGMADNVEVPCKRSFFLVNSSARVLASSARMAKLVDAQDLKESD